MSVCGLVRCQSRSITFVLPTADGDPPPPLIPTRWQQLPPPTTHHGGAERENIRTVRSSDREERRWTETTWRTQTWQNQLHLPLNYNPSYSILILKHIPSAGKEGNLQQCSQSRQQGPFPTQPVSSGHEKHHGQGQPWPGYATMGCTVLHTCSQISPRGR